jgi:gamma-glutamyl-gamma-aminobutyraldehyde dehydrogenase
VAAAVLPWNFPLLMMAWKIGPALATGNSVIIKPSELTSMSALRLARLALDAGIPNGVLNVVPGTGEEAGQAIGLHPDINIVSFTGSTETGRKFLEYSARSNMKRVVLECGGKNPCVVLDDVADLDKVAERQAFSILTNMGENCASNSRLIVHRSVKEALVEKLVRQFESWKIGDPLDPETQLGAMIGKEHFDKVTGYIEKGRAEGATVRSGGHAIESDGYFIPPTLLDDVRSDMAVFRDEIFGPVLSVVSVASDEEAVAVANDTRYGLTASLYTGSVRKAHTIARRLNAGTVSVNCFSEGDLSTPFGGFKMSGFGGRDNGIHAHDQYTELKTIWLDLSD